MKILIACEFSGIVREAFAKKGHQVVSCDLLPTEQPCSLNSKHYQGNVFDILDNGGFVVSNPNNFSYWYDFEPDLMIAHPPCTYLCIANAPHYSIKKYGESKVAARREEQKKAINFFCTLLKAPIKKKCIENPRPLKLLTNVAGKYDQVVYPYWFGHPESKTTCLWLENLPRLEPSKIVERGEMVKGTGKRTNPAWSYLLPNNKDRWKIRSTTFQGIAEAMADQWGINE